MMRPEGPLTVVGAGYVGLTTSLALTTLGFEVRLVENGSARRHMLLDGRVPIHEPGLQQALDDARSRRLLTVAAEPADPLGLTMICVGTPVERDGRADLGQVRSALSALEPRLGPRTVLVLRSTLPIGSMLELREWTSLPSGRIFTNPEFLRQGSALADALSPDRIVIGRFPDAEPQALRRLRAIFATAGAPILEMSIEESCLVKNGANAFLALRLAFVNELAGLAEVAGGDVGVVLRTIGLDARIGTQYLRPGLGFGGSCLPKELRAIAEAGRVRGLPMQVASAATEANQTAQRRFVERIAGACGGLAGRRIALLGLAFKAGTDDVRDSPALAVASMLLGRGADVCAYDPHAAANALLALPSLRLCPDAATALDGADAAIVATEWPEFAHLDWASIRGRMAAPLVFDGRRLLDPETMANLGFRYVAVGTPEPVPSAVRPSLSPTRPVSAASDDPGPS